jgi:predicted metal-dependent hydrolase
LRSRASRQQLLPLVDDSCGFHPRQASSFDGEGAGGLNQGAQPPGTLQSEQAVTIREPVRVDFVRHPRARRYVVRVRPDGSVRVTIPRRGSHRDAVRFFESQAGWVRKQLTRLTRFREHLPEEIPAAEQRRLRQRASAELPPRLRQLAQPLGLAVRKVSIRDQRHRWGSCSPTGHICLNWRLVTMPGWVQDYVLYHELMHLKRMDHSRAFWRLVAQVCPDYESARVWLRRYGHAPHAASSDAFREPERQLTKALPQSSLS